MKMRDVVIIIVLLVWCGFCVAAGRAWLSNEQHIGYFNISKNPYGIAIYQEGKRASAQFTHADSFQLHSAEVNLVPSTGESISITYSRDDIIFDTGGTLYTEPTQEQIDYLEKTTGKSFVKTTSSPRNIPIHARTIYLINPTIPGMLEIQLPETKTIMIDRNKKRVTSTSTDTKAMRVIVRDDITL